MCDKLGYDPCASLSSRSARRDNEGAQGEEDLTFMLKILRMLKGADNGLFSLEIQLRCYYTNLTTKNDLSPSQLLSFRHS